MSKKSCPKTVPGLNNMPKNTKKVSPPIKFIHYIFMGLDDTVVNIKSKWSIGFDCPHPVIFSPFGILTICLIYKRCENISKKTTMPFAFKMLKQKFLHTCFIVCIFSMIAFVIFPSKSEFISGIPFILLTTTLRCEKINQTAIIKVEFMVYLETFACCSARRCVSFFNI